jgi:thiamine-phosphate pyrophosphorylase
LDLVRLASTHEQRAWFAIGGINRETVGPVRSAGARRVAVVRAVTDAPDPAKAVRELLERLGEDPT